jgi:hypothetical protein
MTSSSFGMADPNAGSNSARPKKTFSDPDVAARLRDVIKQVAGNTVDSMGTNPNVARVMSVDLGKLTASVWFPTDDFPVQVNLFPDVIPLDMGDFRNSGMSDTPAVGTGGLVYVEQFRGKPYITRVLSGGTYALNANFLGQTQRMFNATLQGTLTGPPVTGDVYERHVNVIVNNGQAFVQGNALLVGPWSGKNDGSSIDGIIEMTLNYWVTGAGLNQARKYTFSISDRMIVDLPSGANKPFWMRLIPEKSLGTSPHAELAVDVGLVKTGIRTTLEFWFRLVPLDTWADQSVYFMSVKTFGSSFNVGDPKTGRILMIQQTVADPLQGWVGFNNSGMGWTEKDEMGTFVKGTWFQGEEWSNGSWRSGPLRAANDLARTWHVTSQWTWYADVAALFWEGNIVFSGIGPNYNALHNGSLSVPMPTGVAIPVFPATPGSGTGNQIRALDGSGRIPLNAGDTLYYALQPGSGTGGQSASMYPAANTFFIVDNKNFNATNYNFSLPEWAIPIATRPLTVNAETRDIYIHNPAVQIDITDTATYQVVSYATSHSGIIGGDDTETMFVPSFRFRAKTAYRVSFKCGLQSTVACGVSIRLRKGSTVAGADYGEFFRFPVNVTGVVMAAGGQMYVMNDTNTDVVTDTVICGQSTGANTSTWIRYANATTNAWVLIERVGFSAKYAGFAKQV